MGLLGKKGFGTVTTGIVVWCIGFCFPYVLLLSTTIYMAWFVRNKTDRETDATRKQQHAALFQLLYIYVK